MHIFNAGGSARWGPVPFMKKDSVKKRSDCPTNLKTGTEFRLAFCEKTALAGERLPMAILNRNKPEFYGVPAPLFGAVAETLAANLKRTRTLYLRRLLGRSMITSDGY